jgi:hypothetical protein
MLEWLAPSFLYALVKDAWAWMLRRRRRNLSPSQLVELRKKWKAEFELKIWETHNRRLRKDVIIRDIKRTDSYPHVDSEVKVPPWFRTHLAGTYHRGILVAHDWYRLTKHEGEYWRFTNYEADERGEINVLMISSIPYEYIENVDWDGDEFYGFPHIYCFFGRKKWPYGRTAFYTEKTNFPGGLPFYTEIAPYDAVHRLSKKLSIPISLARFVPARMRDNRTVR